MRIQRLEAQCVHLENFAKGQCASRRAKLSFFAFVFILFFGVAKDALGQSPVITSIVPATVVTGQPVTITGTNFGTGSGYVMFGDIPSFWPASWTNTQIVITVPASAQSAPVYIQTSAGGQSNAVNLTVAFPTITSISPATASVGQQVTITGTNFGTANGYTVFGTIFDPYNTSWTNTQIVVTVPANAQSGAVYLQNMGGGQSNSVNLTVMPPPNITSISPATVVTGQPVTITGTNFGTGSGYVMFGNVPSFWPTSWTNTQIVITVPASAQSAPAYLQTAGGAQSNAVNLTVAHPTITSISPATASVGQQVTITGTNFGTANGYTVFGTIFDPYNTSWSNTQIVVTVPANAQSGAVYIQNMGGGQSNAVNLTVVPPSTITSISPATVVTGQPVTITGTNFGTGSGYVMFGNVPSFWPTSWTNTQIVITVPASAQSAPVYIQTSGGGQSNSVNLTVVFPTITSISPATASVGQQVTITGTNFGTANGYTVFGTIFDPYNTSWSNTQIVVTVPANAQSGAVYIQNMGGGQSNSVNLTISSGAAAASLSPTGLTFASQAVGATSPAQIITLNNTGGAALTLTSIALSGTNPGDFAQTNNCGSSVAAGANCTINVTFEPTASGSRTAAVTLTDNATGSPQSVSLAGTGAAPVASLSPASLTFASQAVGNATAPQTITLTNTGNAALSISSIAITGVSINDFTQTNTCGSSVAAGSKCTISITFTPTAIGARSAGVTLTDNAAGSPQTVSLTGTGTAAYASPSPSSLAFASQAIGTTSAVQAVILTNTGNSTLTIYSIALTGTNASDFAQINNCGSSLAAGVNCTVSVTFTPAASGTRTAAIAFNDSAYNSPQTVALTGTGAAPVVSLSPPSVTFASQVVGTTSAAQTVTISNTGNAALSISSMAVSGTNASNFAQNSNCGGSVAAGGTCAIAVIFSPSASGALTASLAVVNSTGNPLTVSLSGTGSAVAASLSATSLVFGSLPVGTASPAQTVILSNTGMAALSISGVAISGVSAGSFSQSNSCGSSLAAGANCLIGVTFSPSSTGALVATLSVADNASGSSQTVSLMGTGTTTAPGQTVSVVPSDDLQTLVNEYPASTTFSLAPGMYRLQSVVPQSGDSFVGQTGAILSGAALLTNFVQDGSYWTAQVSVTQQASYPGTCLSTSPVCMYPEDLFFNNVLRTRVASLTDVGPGTWYLDYNAQTAYIGDDPSGQTVEISELPYAFSGGASNVTISNLVVEKYAALAQSAAIQPYGTGWTVEDSEVRFNHGRGVSTNSGMNVTNNNIHNNGNLGVGGGGSNVTLSDNQISYNNASGYDWTWEAGGAKFAGVTGLTVQNNNSFNNNGPGFWNDINSETVTYTGNQTSGNVEAGILIEISDTVTITNNTIVNDGFVAGESGLYSGAGILISTSSNVTISGNTITNCMNGISGVYSDRGNNPSGVPYTLSNVVANGNTITQGAGYAMGIVTEGTEAGTTAVYTSMGNNFSGNTFVLTALSTGMYFYWNNQPLALAAWNSTVN